MIHTSKQLKDNNLRKMRLWHRCGNSSEKRVCYTKMICWTIISTFTLSGCTANHNTEEPQPSGNETVKEAEIERKTEIEIDNSSAEEVTDTAKETSASEPEIVEADWSEYFEGLNGTAVIYDASNMQYTIFNSELASIQRSPCSTFKIISSLIALENGVIDPEQSTRTWSGEVFWNENWNHDIDFREAFHESCVWYFREVIDEIGPDMIQQELDKLQYGNCDISDWAGVLNTNNSNRALTGFWIESSLTISPKEQTEVMERIFGTESVYSEETRDELKKVMLVPEQNETDISIYGKTGMGKAEGVVVDAWFTGFAEKADEKIYFCVYLGRTDDKNVSSTLAKEIAIQLVSEYYDNF